MTKLTVALAFYENQQMLSYQFANWMAWPRWVRDRLKIIIVDDGSPDFPAVDVPRPRELDIELYRVLIDRPWGQNFCKNIAASVAPEGWMLLTDMDHTLSPDSAEELFELIDARKLDEGTIYMLDRIEADTDKPTLNGQGLPKPHPNSFVVTRHLFWDVIEGYDLEFTGYGTDSVFRAKAFARAKQGHLRIPLTRYWRDIIPDASTRTLGRKGSEYQCHKAAILDRKRREGREHETLKMLEGVPWERIV